MDKTRTVLAENRKTAGTLKQGFINQKTALELRRNKLEDALLDGTIERDTFKRKHSELQGKIMQLEQNMQDVDVKANMDIELIEEVLAFTRNIKTAYIDAPHFLKRHYLRFFFEKIYVKDKRIYRTIPTPIFLALQANHQVIIRNAPRLGFEPRTLKLTASCSTAELSRNVTECTI